MFQPDNVGAEDFPQAGVSLAIDILATVGFGVFALCAMIGVAVIALSFA